MKKLIFTLLPLFMVTNVSASVINGDFESGMTAWTVTSGVSTTPSAISGSASAFISNSTLSLSGLDNFFSLNSGTFSNALDCTDEPCIEGSGFYQTINHQIGDVLTFDWMASLENTSLYVDWVALVVEDTVIQLGHGFNTTDNFLYNTSYTFNSSGTSNLGFTVGDGGDSCCGSNLKVDNVATTSVPEPASLALLSLGLAGIGFSRKKKSA